MEGTCGSPDQATFLAVLVLAMLSFPVGHEGLAAEETGSAEPESLEQLFILCALRVSAVKTRRG